MTFFGAAMSAPTVRLLVIYFVIFFLFRTANCYIMPMCSENGGVCNEQGDGSCGSNDFGDDNSHLFSFVTDLMDVTKTWLYANIFGIEREHESEKSQNYVELLISLFGSENESTESEEEPSTASHNYSVLGLICTIYFAYLFMATKCLNNKRPADRVFFAKKFVNYLQPDNESTFFDMDDDVNEEPNPTDYPVSYSKCWVCEQQKLSMESQSETMNNVEPIEISIFPLCGVTEYEK